MYKFWKIAAAVILVNASSMAFAGTLNVGGTVRDFADVPRLSNLRGVSSARISTLPVPRATAVTPAPKVMALDQPRVKPAPDSSSSAAAGMDGIADNRWPIAFGINWRRQSGIVNPQEIVSRAHTMRRTGLPIVHLWQSDKNLVALGLSPRGVPGVYFTQRLGNGALPP
ncbi:MAG TPA: hypothetical protein VGI65_00095 [Steroidobacteraceae bacterium]|jgi:hypothetical protein